MEEEISKVRARLLGEARPTSTPTSKAGPRPSIASLVLDSDEEEEKEERNSVAMEEEGGQSQALSDIDSIIDETMDSVAELSVLDRSRSFLSPPRRRFIDSSPGEGGSTTPPTPSSPRRSTDIPALKPLVLSFDLEKEETAKETEEADEKGNEEVEDAMTPKGVTPEPDSAAPPTPPHLSNSIFAAQSDNDESDIVEVKVITTPPPLVSVESDEEDEGPSRPRTKPQPLFIKSEDEDEDEQDDEEEEDEEEDEEEKEQEEEKEEEEEMEKDSSKNGFLDDVAAEESSEESSGEDDSTEYDNYKEELAKAIAESAALGDQQGGKEPAFDEATRRADEAELDMAKASLESYRRIMGRASMASLPDKGRKLREQVAAAAAKVDELTAKLAAYPTPPTPKAKMPIREKLSVATAFRQPLAPSEAAWEEKPQTPKAKGPWKMPPPARKDYARLYADGHYGKHLFGGVMTEQRMAVARTATLEAIRALHASLESIPGEEDLSDPPNKLKADLQLMRHQQWGLTWMLWRESQSPPGGILADDMGLGKTLSVISLILKDAQNKSESGGGLSGAEAESRKRVLNREEIRPVKSTLVVTPASVVNQWAAEIQCRTKSGRMESLLYHGPGRKKYGTSSFRDHDVVITTYDVVASEVGAGEEKDEDKENAEKDSGDWVEKRPQRHASPLMRVAWHRIVLDEAHMIKNHNSRRAKAAFRLRATHRWALSGTPIHNSLSDLYSLLRFLRCSPLDEISVWKEWVENGRNQAKSKERLNTIVKALVLRRTKDQKCSVSKAPLVSLPPKEEKLHELDLKPSERAVYDQLFKASQFQAAQFLYSASERGAELSAVTSGEATASSLGYRNPFAKKSKAKFSTSSSDSNFARMREILVMLLRLRQAAVHLHLIREGVEMDALTLDMDPEDAASAADTLRGGLDPTLLDSIGILSETDESTSTSSSRTSSVNHLFDPAYPSTKIEALLSELRLIVEGEDKVVIVSQWASVLSLLLPHLEALGDIPFTEISGKVEPKERQVRVEAFNQAGDGPRVMLLSLTAGGVGLNLTGANHLFLLDLHWNPALEAQACDRIYRMGQAKPVTIHKFICRRTIETRVRELQLSKTELATSVLSGAGQKRLNKLTLKDLRLLFELDTTATTNPDDSHQVSSGLFGKHHIKRAPKASIYAPDNKE